MHTERGFDRLVNFSDAVVAIAITLLILPLVDTAATVGTESAGKLVVQNGYKLFVFVLSFAVIGRFWLVHHHMYENVIGYTDALLWANLVWLLSIVFLPFPTELLASANHHDAAGYSGLYVGTLVVTTSASLAQQWIIMRTPSIQAEDVRGTLTIIPSAVTTAIMIVALVIAVTIPAIGLWALLLLGLSNPAERLLQRQRRRAA